MSEYRDPCVLHSHYGCDSNLCTSVYIMCSRNVCNAITISGNEVCVLFQLCICVGLDQTSGFVGYL